MPHANTTPPGSTAAIRQGAVIWIVLVSLLVLLTGSIASIGGTLTWTQATAAAIYWIARSSWPGAVYLASSIGLGFLASPLIRHAHRRWPLQAAIGIAIQLSAGHAINWAGFLLPGMAWNVASLVPGVLGLVLLAISLRGSRDRLVFSFASGAWMIAAGACTLAAAVMLVAACQPPGLLWASEFGGFDALSYHLQLPREWLELGGLTPLSHNVYSYLPSYVESAFLTLQLWTFAPRTTPSGVSGMLNDDGWRTLACQMLHVGFGLLAAWLIAAATRELAGRSTEASAFDAAEKSDARTPLAAEWLAAAAFLSVPWVVVVGSMAYNELALCALFAGAMLAGVDRGLGATSRALLIGFLVGVACGVKPTALVLAAPAAGLTLLWYSPVRDWLRVLLLAAMAGVLALSPWLVRNYLASQNPVFPYLYSILGSGHWTAEQFGRFLGAHHFDGSWTERLGLLFFADMNDPAGPRHRGMMHPQWSGFFPIVGASILIGLAARRTHRCAALLTACLLLQAAAWLALTHLQSRFLLPLVVPGAMLIGLVGCAAWLNAEASRFVLWSRLTVTVAALSCGFFAMRSLDAFWSESGGRPNQALALGPGALVQDGLRAGDGAQVKPGEVLYLLGDSTPFYVPGPLVYHTTWDASPLGDAIRSAKESENAPFVWSGALLDRGIGAVLLNFSELGRLIESGWYDPAVTRAALTRWFDATAPARPLKETDAEVRSIVRPIRTREAVP